jgi:hypothetical protein
LSNIVEALIYLTLTQTLQKGISGNEMPFFLFNTEDIQTKPFREINRIQPRLVCWLRDGE